MSKEKLQNIITDFDPEKFIHFFREKNNNFSPRTEDLYNYNDDNFYNCTRIGKIDFPGGVNLIVCSMQTDRSLSERSGKKSQYEKGKKILKDTQSDAGIFIFYDDKGNFRFSLIYANYLGKKRDWSTFKRFTYFVSKEFTNKTFLIRIGDGDFSDLEKIKEAFSVEKVTKEFYRDIAYWYFWAVKETRFPKDAEEEDKGRNMSVIRMITRIIFIWFMKERGLIKPDLFNYDKLSKLLNSISKKETTYYKAILQNLFFATLNTKIKERKFRFNIKGWKNRSYMDHTVYRYEDYFKDKNDMLGLFKDIPFLNGGLFDCLDKRVDENGKITEFRYDGFSDKEKGLKVPNELFFSDETPVDLNSEYGTKGKKYAAKGLINILSSYNFVIDENDPNDAEVALDPELLGKVFENLLASFNPETSSTARKATGSYYTPREIVDYMVTQSLKEYFKTNLDELDETEKKLDILFSTDNQTNPFDTTQTRRVVELTDNLRIVDPAVGSGAFPMGILNKLVFILSKLDRDNVFWKNQQIKAVEENISDPVIRQSLKNNIEEQFADKNPDYGRKLYLIEKCIYGVDIQQIAVEIAKLRFFISLLVDENIDKSKDNWGIKPLPNLDYKIMQGNSLLEEYKGIKLIDEKIVESPADEKTNLRDELKKRQSELQSEYIELNSKKKLTKVKATQLTDELNKIKEQIKTLCKPEKGSKNDDLFDVSKESKELFAKIKLLREEFFIESNRVEKDKIKEDIEDIEWKFIETSMKEQKKESEIGELKKIIRSNRKPYFLWHFNFGEVFNEKGGFDVVIGNPPYIRVQNLSHSEIDLYKNKWSTAWKRIDISTLFIELGFTILNSYGDLCYISSNQFITTEYGRMMRKYLLKREAIKLIVDFGDLAIFENSLTYVSIFFITKLPRNYFFYKKVKELPFTIPRSFNRIETSILSEDAWSLGEFKEIELIKFLKTNFERLDAYAKCWAGIITGNDELLLYNIDKQIDFIEKKLLKPVIRAKGCERYGYAVPSRKVFYPYYENESHTSILQLDVLKKSFPNAYTFVNRNRRQLKARKDSRINFGDKVGWYGLIRFGRLSTFNKPKIVSPGEVKRNKFSLDLSGSAFSCARVFSVTSEDESIDIKYLLAILNSKLVEFYLHKISSLKQGGYYTYSSGVIDSIPFKVKKELLQSFVKLVDQILRIKSENKDTTELENQIDLMVYKLYELTYDEVKIVDPEFWMSEGEFEKFSVEK